MLSVVLLHHIATARDSAVLGPHSGPRIVLTSIALADPVSSNEHKVSEKATASSVILPILPLM